MNYKLRLSTRYDGKNWNRETYRQDSKQYLLRLIDKYKQLNGQYVEGYEYVEIPESTPEIEQLLRKECESKGVIYDIWVALEYSQKDIKNARYVRFGSGSSYNGTDYDGEGIPYNFYKGELCDTCGICDLDKIPSPYRVSKRILEDQREISSESNGVTLLADWAFTELREEIEPWVVWGGVEFADSSKFDVIKQKYIWIRPINKVGPYVDAKILQKCEKCDWPTEIRQRRSENIFEADKQTVESFKDIKAPVVLAGNWFGEIHKRGVGDVNRDVFINPVLYEKVRKMKLKGLYKVEYVIHAADEPYDWDPLYRK